MGRASRRKRQRRLAAAAEAALTPDERALLGGLIRAFEHEHGRLPVAGDVLYTDDDGGVYIARDLPPGLLDAARAERS